MSIYKKACPPAWLALGNRLAVAAGAACALVSLWWDAPASAAALHGLLAWFAVLAHFRLSARVLGWRLLQEAVEEGRSASASANGN